MADPYYSILIQLGDPAGVQESWTVTHTGDPHAADALTPISGLRFGWSMPDGLIWPVQPNPMTATFAFTVPDFTDLSWVTVDTPVAIEVTLESGGPVLFAFYGRLTDAKAGPRPGRPGVTLSGAAVDYTIDLGRAIHTGGDFGAGAEYTIMQTIWASKTDLLGTVPTWPIPSVSGNTVELTGSTGQTIAALVSSILAQAIRQSVAVPAAIGGGYDGALSILAPRIDPSTRLLHATQPWAFDLAYKHAHTFPTIAADIVERESLGYGQNKALPVDQVNVYIANGTWAATEYSDGSTMWRFPTGMESIAEVRTVSSDLFTRPGEIASFYAREDLANVRPWNAEGFKVLLDQLAPADFADFPEALMPRWADTLGDASRSQCYGTVVEVTGVPDHTKAEAGRDLVGLVSGVEFSLVGGRPALDMKFRHLLVDTTPTDGYAAYGYGHGGYAVTPYAALIPEPA